MGMLIGLEQVIIVLNFFCCLMNIGTGVEMGLLLSDWLNSLWHKTYRQNIHKTGTQFSSLYRGNIIVEH